MELLVEGFRVWGSGFGIFTALARESRDLGAAIKCSGFRGLNPAAGTTHASGNSLDVSFLLASCFQ